MKSPRTRVPDDQAREDTEDFILKRARAEKAARPPQEQGRGDHAPSIRRGERHPLPLTISSFALDEARRTARRNRSQHG